MTGSNGDRLNFQWGLDKICKEYLAREQDIALKEGWSLAAIRVRLAIEIVGNALGPVFLNREFPISAHERPRIRNIDDPYFLQLAEMIWNLRNCKGFEKFITTHRTRSKQSLFSELYFAYMFNKQSREIAFNIPSGEKGGDFDLKIFDFEHANGGNYESIFLEVKTRDHWFNKRKSVKNFLGSARQQLPANEIGGVGILFEKVPEIGEFSQQEFERAISEYLNSTSRILFVVYFWIEKGELESGKRYFASKYAFVTSQGRTAIAFQPEIRDGLSFLDTI